MEQEKKKKYGNISLDDIEKNVSSQGKKIELEVEFKQSNVEGEIVNFIQEARKNHEVLLLMLVDIHIHL